MFARPLILLSVGSCLWAQTDLLSTQGGTAIPPMTWTSVTATGDEIGYVSGNVDGCVYVQSRHALACHEQFRSQSSEPNQNWTLYSVLENRNALVSADSRFQSPYWSEPGHPSGDFAIDPTNSVAYSMMGNSGDQLNGEAATKTTVRFDFGSLTGRRSETATGLQFNTNLTSCTFDSWRRKEACWGGDGSSNQLLLLDPSANTWTVNPTLTGTCPITGLQSASLAFDNADGNLYLFGGKSSFAVTGASWSSGTATVNVTTASPVIVGQLVTIAAVSPSGYNCTDCVVTGVTSNTISYAVASNPGTYSSSGAVEFATNTLYTINVGSSVCSQLSPSGPPGPRGIGSWVYASRENLFVLVGGSASGSSNTCTGGSSCYIDTWTYDPVGNAWNNISSTVGTPTPSTSVGPLEYRIGYDEDLDAIVSLPQPTSGNSSITFWYLRLQPGPNIGTLTLTHSPSSGGLNHDSTAYAQLGATLAASSTDVYLGFAQFGSGGVTSGNGAYGHTYVQDITTGSGVNVPNPSTFSSLTADATGTAIEAFDSSVAIIGGSALWDCWNELSGSSITIRQNCKEYSGGSWSVGGPATGIQPSGSHVIGPAQLIDVGGAPTMSYIDNVRTLAPLGNSDTANVAQYSAGSWSIIGSQLNVAAFGTNIVSTTSTAIVSDGGSPAYPYAAWSEYVGTSVSSPVRLTYTSSQVYLKHYNGSTWSLMCGGTANVTSTDWADSVSLAMYGGNPAVAFTERAATGYPRVYVRACISGTWTTLGSGYLNRDQTYGWAYTTKLIAGGSNLYLAWDEQGVGTSWSTPPNAYESSYSETVHAYADVWNGSTWSSLGGAMNADTAYSSATWPGLTYFNSQPVAAWGEAVPNTNRTMYAKTYNGTDWAALGNASPSCSITPTSESAATVGQSISWTFTANNCGPNTLTWTVSGSLPTGLSGCNSTTGTTCTVSGTASAAGSFTPTVNVTDGGSNNATDPLTLTVNAAPTITNSSPLPGGTVGIAYSQPIATSGGTSPVTCSVQSGSLPPGLSMSSTCSTGITGTPTTAGTYSFVAAVTDANSIVGTKSLQITIVLAASGMRATTCNGCIIH